MPFMMLADKHHPVERRQPEPFGAGLSAEDFFRRMPQNISNASQTGLWL